MQMLTNQNIIEFRQKFEKIYKNISERLDVTRWKGIIRSACEEDRSAALAAVVDFAHDHRNLPSVILKTILRESDLRNHPAEAAEIYGVQVLIDVHEAAVETDVIDYWKLPEDCSDARLEQIADHVRKAEQYLERGQLYMAGKEIEILNGLCPGNPGVKKLMDTLNELRATGGIPSSVYSPEKDAPDKRVDKNKGTRLESAGQLEEAAAYYEKIIADNFENYDAYYHLGKIYLKQGQDTQADYIADLLLELGIQESKARVLKGQILEKAGHKEDAFYYYETAFMYDRQSKEAFTEMKRLLAELEGKGANLFSPEDVIDQFIREVAEPDPYDLSRLRVNGQTAEIIIQADDLISRGRMTEAYYELSRASEKYPDFSILIFKKAFALYLMRRGAEARKLLKAIDRDDVLYRKAGYLIEDIECDLRENNALDEVPLIEQAEILFGAGAYNAALARLQKANTASMDASTWALKGRCEVENGRLDQALESFENAIRKDSRIKNVREIMAMIYYVKGDYDKAGELYDAAIRLSGDPEEVCALKAQMLYKLGKKDSLLEFRKSAGSLLGHASDVDGYAGLLMLSEEPDSREAAGYLESALIAGTNVSQFYQAAYNIYMKEGLIRRALLCTDAGIASSTDREQLLFLKACALYKLRKMNSAELISTMLLSGDKKDSRVLYLMGRIQEARGNLSGALKYTLDASLNSPDNHDYAFAIAEMYFNRGEYSKAQVYYTKALVLDGKDYISFKRRAYVYNRQNNANKAIEDINCALLLRPDDPDLYILMGNIISGYTSDSTEEVIPSELMMDADAKEQTAPDEKREGENAGKPKPAIRNEFKDVLEKGPEYYYSKAIEVAPQKIDGYLWRAKCYAGQGRIQDALEDTREAIIIDGQSAKAHMMRGVLLLMSDRAEEARSEFVDTVRLDPENPSAYSYLSRCSQILGEYEKALSAARRGLDVDDNYVDLYLSRGMAYYYLELYQDAIGDFTIVIMRKNEVSPASVEMAFRYKGMAYEKSGQLDNARTNYDMLLKFRPGAPGIRQRMASLEKEIDVDQSKNRFSSLFSRKKNKK